MLITDWGLETTLVFQDGLELPCFAAFDLLKDEAGYRHLRGYFEDYLRMARQHGAGIVPDSATWRASSDWGQQLGYSEQELARLNRRAIDLLHLLQLDVAWLQRIRAVRANASSKSHAELGESKTLDTGNPLELADQLRQLQTMLPRLNVLGGCCGTDCRHIEAICSACALE